MNDPQKANGVRMASALRAGEPGALEALFDTYSGRLYGYCWFLLRNGDLAQIALRDALFVAQAHIGRLADSGNLDSWLYALARAECRRRRPVPPGEADVPPARPSQPDADSRLMAWNAVTSMDPDAMEVLDLASRHDVDLGLVLGLPGHEARGLLDAARQDLERALGAEILVSRAGHACPDRAAVMRGWTGTVTPELRERVLRHAADCRVCGPSLPRNVSATRVFALLPVPSLPSGARGRVLDFFADSRMAAYREFAVRRAAEFGSAGFPIGALSDGGRGSLSGARGGASGEVEAAASGGRDGTLPLDSGPSPSDSRAHGRAAPSGRRAAAADRRVLGLTPRALTAVGTATAVAAVAAAFVFAGQGSQPRSHRQGPTASAGEPIGPRRAGAGVESARPADPPTAVNRSVPRSSPSTSELLFAKVTQPLRGVTQLDPPVSPPRLPGRPLPRPVPSTRSRSAQGSLQVSPGALSLGSAAQGVLTITAEGAPETWTASTPSGQVALGASGGTLQPGQSATLTVSVDRNGGAGGTATIFVDQGSPSAQSVQVSWTATRSGTGTGTGTGTGHHRVPRPKPTPSPSPSSSPSPTPSTPTSDSPSATSPPAGSARPERSGREVSAARP